MRILVTGGAGYFGTQFTLTMMQLFQQHTVCIYSRDEAKHAKLRDQLAGLPDGTINRVRFFTGDVRDKDRLRRAMDGVNWVVHAAALKRIEVCEYDVQEVVKTNVVGSMNVIEAAFDAGVEKVVGLSTDKACDPINAYGASKMMMEKMFLAANNSRGENGPIFAVTRYGNVAGSTGSVIPYFRELIARGVDVLPVTVKGCTRFYMTVEEAVDLVIGTLETMHGGELVVPKWLPAYEITDLATAMDKEYCLTGLRPGEKVHETMAPGLTSDKARRMTIEELRQELEVV